MRKVWSADAYEFYKFWKRASDKVQLNKSVVDQYLSEKNFRLQPKWSEWNR